MNKSEMVDAISAKTGLTKKDANLALDAFVESVMDCVASGEEVGFTGFGKWQVDHRAPRQGRNPATGARIQISGRNVVKFKAGATLKAAANQEKPKRKAKPAGKAKNEAKPKRKRKPARLRDLLG